MKTTIKLIILACLACIIGAILYHTAGDKSFYNALRDIFITAIVIGGGVTGIAYFLHLMLGRWQKK